MKNSKKVMMNILLVILVIAMVAGICFVGYGLYIKQSTHFPNPVATIEVENFGTIKVELYPDKAPNTVTNFIKLANNGFYNDTTFHRVVKDFMIQGGSKKGDGTGNPTLGDVKSNVSEEEKSKDYSIAGEFLANDNRTTNNIKFEKGVIAMARGDYSNYSSALVKEGYNSANAQFFIMHAENEGLNGLYAAFGKVIEGLDIVDKIANVEVKAASEEEDSNAEISTPVETVKITSISVETYGVDYGEPQTQTPFDIQSWFLNQYYNSNNSGNATE